MKKQEKIRTIAQENGWKVRESYSGRGMYGKSCMGIVGESANEIIAAVGIRGAVTDGMGLSYIVYWPSIVSDLKPEGAHNE